MEPTTSPKPAERSVVLTHASSHEPRPRATYGPPPRNLASSMSAPAARVGIDIGGTFTDAVLVDAGSRLHVAKVRTTPADLSAAFLDALGALAGRGRLPAVSDTSCTARRS